MAENDLTAYLESNPKMIGLLFAATLLLTQSGAAAAGQASALPGP